MDKKLRGDAIDTAVDGFREYDVVARAQKAKDSINGGHARTKRVSRVTAFKLGESSLKGLAIGVIGASVVEAFVFAELVLDIGRSLINGENDSASRGIGLLSDVDGICGKTHGYDLL